MDNTGKVNQSNCCDGDDCCPSTQGGRSGKPARWKTMIFTSVVLLACGVAAYSLIWRDDSAATTSCCPPGSPAAATCAQATSSLEFNHESAPIGLTLTALLAEGGQLSATNLSTIGDLRAAIESHGEQLQLVSLHPADSGYQDLVGQHQVRVFPAFVLQGLEGVVVLDQTQFDLDTLKQVYKSVVLKPCTGAAPENDPR